MAWSLDARIPVCLLPDPAALAGALAMGKPAALLTAEHPGPLPEGAVATASFTPAITTHLAACACCQGRSPAAQALDQLFQARARGQSKWFDRVLVLAEGLAGEAVQAALREDSMASARFRLAVPVAG
ncbi:hypothetical protein [Sediminicoccus sp. KRV36]|uniref:hypothetical protein n=1 Tax=Sediminicoccus sp. KRV36 TaxID=3133721 RepID=UPI00200C13B1|nr:hypothetical protein [Sediminicoccus rosea]UPY37486.1 hypothetical protein LHU95_01995 [Sediminicoccus rosea]